MRSLGVTGPDLRLCVLKVINKGMGIQWEEIDYASMHIKSTGTLFDLRRLFYPISLNLCG